MLLALYHKKIKKQIENRPAERRAAEEPSGGSRVEPKFSRRDVVVEANDPWRILDAADHVPKNVVKRNATLTSNAPQILFERHRNVDVIRLITHRKLEDRHDVPHLFLLDGLNSKGAEGYHSKNKRKWKRRLFDNSSTQHFAFLVIKHRGLSRSNKFLWIFKNNSPPRINFFEFCGRERLAIANTHKNSWSA